MARRRLRHNPRSRPGIEELTASTIKCAVHETEHGSDHRTIDTVFDISVPVPKQQIDFCSRMRRGKK